MDNILEKIKSPFHRIGVAFRRTIFGANNEKLDFLMDSFYKLDSQKQSLVLAVGGALIGFVLLLAVWAYFGGVSRLETELNQSFEALHELKTKNTEYEKVESAYQKLKNDIQRKTSRLEYLGFFEGQAARADLRIVIGREEIVALPSENPMSQWVSYYDVPFSIPKVSIPKLLNFLSEIEKSGNFFKVKDLEINAIYGEDSLYFKVDTVIRGYKLNG